MVDPDHLPGAERPKADGISKPVQNNSIVRDREPDLAVDIIGISRKVEPVSQVNGSNPSIRGIGLRTGISPDKKEKRIGLGRDTSRHP